MTTCGRLIVYQSHFFNEYAMDGVSEEHNEIFLELHPENLVKSLKAAQNAKSVKLKLTKKHTACLTLEVELVSVSRIAALLPFHVIYYIQSYLEDKLKRRLG